MEPTTIPPQNNPAPLPPHDENKQRSVFGRVITHCFKTKGSSIGWILLISMLFLFILPTVSFVMNVGPISFLLPVIFWLIVGIIIRSMGYENEARNIGKAIGRIFLILLVLGLIGFGVCLFIFAGWH